jgi:hypothetical protein
MTSISSLISSGDDQIPQAVQDYSEIEQPVMLSTDGVDSDYDEFIRLALGLETQAQWQMSLA